MPSPEFVDAVLDVIRRIPPGRVMTYGDIAHALGSNAPRAVGRVLAYYGHAVTWWRVVPASGLPPQGHSRLALPHYLEEGTPLRCQVSEDDYRIALSSARLSYDHEIYSEVAP
ncbi:MULTISPECIES: MGMT family protein [Actinomycetes]|uniref:Alkylated DNA nucleotide flippase Atl1 n=3 Tax=Paeniglutamicibacter TaxID=1742990 RepID=A0ABU2BM20_9MICC|nr:MULTISPECIES: MGMT family protein [Actinomycetes]MBO1030388.1 MGMT family protein [Tessaracoccus sp. SD287]MDR7359701.1 alkylated DNA nucleotide flippase Atl1 [Paeniglutamicibacter sulfureus]